MKETWAPWVVECIDLLDADGTMRHFPHGLARCDEPAYDMEVLRVIRHRWVELMNEMIKPRMPDGKRQG